MAAGKWLRAPVEFPGYSSCSLQYHSIGKSISETFCNFYLLPRIPCCQFKRMSKVSSKSKHTQFSLPIMQARSSAWRIFGEKNVLLVFNRLRLPILCRAHMAQLPRPRKIHCPQRGSDCCRTRKHFLSIYPLLRKESLLPFTDLPDPTPASSSCTGKKSTSLNWVASPAQVLTELTSREEYCPVCPLRAQHERHSLKRRNPIWQTKSTGQTRHRHSSPCGFVG